jgi:hypothetical protein
MPVESPLAPNIPARREQRKRASRAEITKAKLPAASKSPISVMVGLILDSLIT